MRETGPEPIIAPRHADWPCVARVAPTLAGYDAKSTPSVSSACGPMRSSRSDAVLLVLGLCHERLRDWRVNGRERLAQNFARRRESFVDGAPAREKAMARVGRVRVPS